MKLKEVDKKQTIVVALSGGKDSVATLLTLHRLGYKNLIPVNFDGGWDWPWVGDVLDQVSDVTGFQVTTVKPEHNFSWYAAEKPIKKRDGTTQRGYGWPTERTRWCTRIKSKTMSKWTNANYPGAVTAIGIAANEVDHRPTNEHGKIYPLAELGITEQDGLQLCYDAGVTFGGHYEIWDRLSCLYCPLQGIKNLRRLRNIHHDLWAEIVAIGDRITAYDSLREGATARDLDNRFKLEDEIGRIEASRQELAGQIFRLKAEIKGLKSAL